MMAKGYPTMSPLYDNSYAFASRQFYKSAEFARFTWITSILAMIIGFVKFIRLSPFKTNKNIFMDFLINCGFVLRVTSVILHCQYTLDAAYMSIPVTIVLGTIPFLVNIINLMAKAGIKKTCNLILLYPQIILSPIFTPFLYTYDENENRSIVNEECKNSNCRTRRYEGRLVSCSHSPLKGTNASGFHISTCPSIVNYFYIILIPACIPFHIGTVSPLSTWTAFILPPLVILFKIGMLYFVLFGIGPAIPSVFDPTIKTKYKHSYM